MNAVLSQLPPLSPTDSALLLRLFDLKLNFQALAQELAPTHTLLTLYAWSTRPEIALYITFHREQSDQSLRQTAINALHTILKSNPDPIESRRAATTLLRALSRPPTPRPDSPKSHPSSPRHPPAHHRARPNLPVTPRATELHAANLPIPPSTQTQGLQIGDDSQPVRMTLAEALTALGLPADLDEIDRLDDADDDDDLDGDDFPDDAHNQPRAPDTMPP